MASKQRSPAWKTGPHQEWYTKEVLVYGPRITRGFVFLACLDELLLRNYVADDRAKTDWSFALAVRTKLLQLAKKVGWPIAHDEHSDHGADHCPLRHAEAPI